MPSPDAYGWPGEARTVQGAHVHLSWHALGRLAVPSGRLLACDPFLLSEYSPLPLPWTLAPGRYPVHAATCPVEEEGREGVAVVALRLREGAAVGWQKRGEAPRFIVDSGVGAFADLDAASILAGKLGAVDGRFEDDLARLMHLRNPAWPWANVTLDAVTGVNLLAVQTAWGDDLYACRAGYGADGFLTCLALDYRVIDLDSLTSRA